MRKKLKRWIALGLVICMAGLSGCGNGQTETTQGSSQSEDASGGEAQTEDTAGGASQAAEAESGEDTADTEGTSSATVQLPLCEEKTTLTAFVASSSPFTTGTFTQDIIKNNQAYKKLFEDTNVEIDFIVPANGESESQFNLLIASGNYPDLIIGNNSIAYPGGFDQAIDDGCFVDLTPYAEDLMPNYYREITANDQVWKEATTLNNRIPCAFYLYEPEYDDKELQWWGQAIRKDILDELGLNVPETVEEWEEVLLAMKDHGVEIPYSMINCTGMDQALLAAFGICKAPVDWMNNINFYAKEDGTITYGAIEEGYKDYLTMMNRWYKEGLLDPEFMTRSWISVSNTIYAMYGSGEIGSVYSLDGILPTMVAALESENEKGETVAVPAPRLADGSLARTSVGKLYAGGNNWIAVTSNCKDIELAIRFLDYLCSEEGILITNYGVEGDAYIMKNGIPTYTDLVLNAETGSSDAWRLYSALALCIVGQEKNRNLQFKDASIQEWDRVWTESVEQYSTVYSLTSDEELEAASIMNDISTYVQEQTIKCIIDDAALAAWDSTVEEIYSMGIENAIQIYQDGYDRYNNR